MSEAKLSNLAKDVAMVDCLLGEIADCFTRMAEVFEEINTMAPPPEGEEGAQVGLHMMAEQFRQNQELHREAIVSLMPEKDAIMDFIKANKLAYMWMGPHDSTERE